MNSVKLKDIDVKVGDVVEWDGKLYTIREEARGGFPVWEEDASGNSMEISGDARGCPVFSRAVVGLLLGET